MKEKEERKSFCFVTFEREEVMKEVLKNNKQELTNITVFKKTGLESSEMSHVSGTNAGRTKS